MKHKITDRIKKIQLACLSLQRDVIDMMQEDVDLIKGQKVPTEELIDSGYLLREILSTLEETRKDLEARKNLIDLTITIKAWDLYSTEAPSENKGTLATSMINPKVEVFPPGPGTDKEKMLLAWAKKNNIPDLRSVSYKKLNQVANELAEKGESIPQEIVETHARFEISYRKIKGSK